MLLIYMPERPMANRAIKRRPGIINVLELGPGQTPTDLLRFAKKGGRVLHGIDYGAQEEHTHTSGGSTVDLFRDDFIAKLERDYKPNSIKSVRMKMVMKRGETLRLVFDRLVPGGRFMLSEPKPDLEAAIAEAMKDPSYLPWILVVSKPRK